ncbi:MAG: DUF3568 family protein [Phycisphaerales bacterium]|nr:DUF3568 family protein [Phycisphaerales bacterium]
MRSPTTTPTTAALTRTALLLAALAVIPLGCSSSAPPRPRTTTAGAEATPLSHPGPVEYGILSRELAAIEHASIDNVYAATQDAISGLELRLVEKTKDRLNATLAARTAHDDRVTIALSRLSSGVTDVKIKVGFWGDEAQSRAILTEIRKRLSTPQATDKLDPALTSQPGVLAVGPKPASTTLTTPVTVAPTTPTSPAKPSSTTNPLPGPTRIPSKTGTTPTSTPAPTQPKR